MKSLRHDRWPVLERDTALHLATIPAPRGLDDPAGFAPGQIPVNDDTRPDDSLLAKARQGIDNLLARNGRKPQRED